MQETSHQKPCTEHISHELHSHLSEHITRVFGKYYGITKGKIPFQVGVGGFRENVLNMLHIPCTVSHDMNTNVCESRLCGCFLMPSRGQRGNNGLRWSERTCGQKEGLGGSFRKRGRRVFTLVTVWSRQEHGYPPQLKNICTYS